MKDRSLGNEWKNWRGEVENSDATIGLFLLLSFIFMAIFSLVLLFGNYLLYPRLAQLHPSLPVILQTGILVFIVFMGLWLFLIFISVLFNINLLFGLDKKLFMTLSSHTTNFAKRFGISNDRLGNSFVKLNNRLVKIKKHVFKSCDILILLPRCINPQILKEIKNVTAKYNVNHYILHGGEAARARVKEHSPKAIVAIACERDLVAGIKDVPYQILVHGIPNCRPDGPCKNTTISVSEFENSIRMFLGMPAL